MILQPSLLNSLSTSFSLLRSESLEILFNRSCLLKVKRHWRLIQIFENSILVLGPLSVKLRTAVVYHDRSSCVVGNYPKGSKGSVRVFSPLIFYA